MTVVPPVTALRSPPDSRTTGADSPVTAASLTRAAPATTSPSPAIISSASTRIRSPLRSWLAPTSGRSRCRIPACQALGRDVGAASCASEAARALPRPSASASAKVEKMTVSQSQRETVPVNQAGSLLAPVSDMTKVTRVMTLAISTQNMTGLRQRVRGSSFLRESSRAPCRAVLQSKIRYRLRADVSTWLRSLPSWSDVRRSAPGTGPGKR